MKDTGKTAAFEQQEPRLVNEFVIKLTPFDDREALRLMEARGQVMRLLVKKLIPALHLSTALDAGCGVGYFSQMLHECGLNVRGIDGRPQNVSEARSRFPDVAFAVADVERHKIRDLGVFDLVLCFGLLYHLENPLLAIRNLHAMTAKCLLLESMCVPQPEAGALLREEPRQDNQSLTEVAFYPSEATLVKMLYRAGFRVVYRVLSLPEHEDFRETVTHHRRRTMLLASCFPVDFAGLRLCPEARDIVDPWSKGLRPPSGLLQRTRRFIGLSARQKYFAVAQRARRYFPMLKIPFRLPFGAWWLAEGSVLDAELARQQYEVAELKFVERLLRPGMTVLDAGAHHGLYSLLAAKCVGPQGRVIAFEPSLRERERLGRHVKINRAANVLVQPFALGASGGEEKLYVVQEGQDGCNSLRRPAVSEPVSTLVVEVRQVDEELRRLGVTQVDFVKLDVEGGELGVLRGAEALWSAGTRPVILAEVQDLRTRPWGYAAREIIRFLELRNYRWFALDSDGSLVPVSTKEETYDANLVAVPADRVRQVIVELNEGNYRNHRPKPPVGLRWSAIASRERRPVWLTSRSYKSWLPAAHESPGSQEH